MAKEAKQAAAVAKAKEKEEFDAKIAARRAAQKPANADGEFDAKRKWKLAGNMAKFAVASAAK